MKGSFAAGTGTGTPCLAAQQDAFGHRRPEWLDRLDADHENLRAAIEFCLSEPREVAAGAQMACDLCRYWETHGHLTEGRRILAAVLAKVDETAPIRPRALWVAGYLAELQGDILDARARLEAGISAARDTGDIRAIAYASTYLGPVLYSLREPARGHAVTEIALRLHREDADQLGVALALMRIGFMYLCAGEAREASDRFSECARVSESSDNVWYHTYAQWGLAVATWLLADHDSAATLASEALRTMRGIDDPMGIALCLDTLGWIAAESQPHRGVVLLGAADAAWSAFLLALPPAFRERHDAALHRAQAALPGSAYLAACQRGNAMSQAQAIAFALGESPQPAPPSDGTQDGGAACSSRAGSRTSRCWWPAECPTARSLRRWSSQPGPWKPTYSTSWISSASAHGRGSPPGQRPCPGRAGRQVPPHMAAPPMPGPRRQITRQPAGEPPEIRDNIRDSPDARRAARRHRV